MTQPPEGGPRFVTGLTDPQLVAMEVLAEDLMIEVLTQVADFYADRLVERAAAAGAVVALVAATDGLPPGRSFVSPDDFQGIVAATDEAINRTIMPLVSEVYVSGAGSVRRGMVEATAINLPPIHSATGAAYLRQHADLFAGIGDEMGAAVRAGLAEGFELGESIPQLADRVRGAAGTTARSATLTARTAVIDAANRGSIDTARASEIPMLKEWMATPDARTRQTHKNADGQRVDINGKFTVGGHECDYPAEYTLPPEERLRCRCTIGYEIPDFTPAELDDIRDRVEERYVYDAPDVEDVADDLEALSLPAARQADEAMRLTVAELKAVAKRNNVPLLGLTKKADIVAHLRSMESAMGRKFEGLPVRPLNEFELSRAERRPAPDAATVLTGRRIGREWWESMPPGDTGPAGVRAERFVVGGTGTDVYTAPYGTAWRIDGTAYFVEHEASEYGSTKVARALQQMIDANADVPLASKSNDGYAYLLRPNPADAFWKVQYNDPNHVSDASAGRGGVWFWFRSKWPEIERETLRHETGHNLDSAKGTRPHGYWTSDSFQWEDAATADAKVASLVTSKASRFGVVDRRRDWRWGVTEYGKSSRAEDFAESVMLYQRGKIARGVAVGESVERDLYFRDFYPNRAAMLDGIFPDIASEQVAAIRALRAGRKVERSPVLDNAGKRAAARARQADIDRASRYASALADIDYEVRARRGFPDADIDRAVADAVLTKTEATALRKAIEAGDRVKLAAVFDRIAGKRGIKLNGRSGDLAPFDADTMRSSSADLPPAGELVRVQRGGSVLTRDGEEIQLARAEVRRVTPDELAAERVRAAEPATNMAKLADDIARDPGPLTGARVGQLADRANVGRATREVLVKAAGTPDGLKRAIAAELRKVKAKAAGVANRAVDFDPDTMQAAPGVTIPPGTRVRVVRTGYTTEVDGDRVVVLRTLVEPVAPKVVKKAAKAAGNPPERKKSLATTPQSARLEELAGQESTGQNLGGGTANVELRTYADGEQAVQKTYRGSAAEVKAQVDAEVLGPRVLDAFDLRSAATIKVNNSTVLSEYVTGHKTAAEVAPGWGRSITPEGVEAVILGSEEGRLMGLADYVMTNVDRNPGNFFIIGKPGGQLLGIDHGFAFQVREFGFSDFAQYLGQESDIAAGRVLRASIPELADVDFDRIRTRLLALEPEFIALKREAWFKRVMSRLAAAEKAAKRGRAEREAAQVVTIDGRPAAKPAPIHQLIEADDATIEAAMKDVFEGKFGPYTTKVDVSVARAGTDGPSIGISGRIYDAKGGQIGEFERSIKYTTQHYPDGLVRRELWAEHHIVQLGDGDYDANPTKYHGKGFGGAFNRRAIDWYRRSGVHGISQSDHNGYVWASQGFNFPSGIVPAYKMDELRELIADLRAGRKKNKYDEAIPKSLREATDLDAQISAAEDLLARYASLSPGQPGYPTAYEISQLGRRGRTGKTSTWLGKHLGVSADEMILNPDEGEIVSR